MKKSFIKIILLLITIWIYFPIYAQQGDTLFVQRGKSGKIEFARFKKNANSNRKMKNDTTFLKSMLKARKEDGFHLEYATTDELGIVFKKFQQYYKGIKVDNAEYLLQGKDDDIEVANGDFQEDISIADTKPSLSEAQALQRAVKYVNAEIYKWQIPEEEAWIKANFKESYYPAGELVIIKDQLKTNSIFCLAYKFNIYAHKPLSRDYIYVDANTGEIVAKEPLILFANANGTADTRYSGTRSIVTDSYTNGFRLHELRNNVRIETYNMGGTGVYSLTEFSNNDNNWSAVKFNNANMDNAALDAHWGTEMVYEYFHQIHGRNSWDSAGGPLLNYVHANLQTLGYPNNDNAFWDGQRMTYGDGQYTFYPLTSLDIIAHEIGHGVMQKSGKLTNTGESGALNEGFSDIWAACVKHWAAPEKPLWLQGGEPIRDRYHFNCLRDMQNPGSDSAAEGHHPDAYGGTNWQNVNSCIPISSGLNANDNCYVHNNSTVLSHWFYLLCQGGNSTNSLGNAYNVNVIGIAQAEKIAYRTQTTLFSSAKYTDVRNASIQAAIYLYGAGSCQEVAVTNVWYAVGVGAAYSGNGTFPISGPSIVCSSGTYSISNVPAGSTVTWSISSTSAFTLAPSGNSVVVNRVGTYSGTATLFATINRGSCSIPVSKTVSSTGSANMTFSMTGSCTGGVPQWWDVTATSDNITYHLWTVASASPGAVVNLYQNGGNNLNASASISSGYATLKLTTTDACGNTTIYGVPIYNPCVSAGSSYSVSPNPASSTVDIQPVTASMDLSSTSSTSAVTPEITQVNIYDKSGNCRHQQGFSKVRRAKLNVANLPAGIYYVEIIMNDGTKEKHTLSVAH